MMMRSSSRNGGLGSSTSHQVVNHHHNQRRGHSFNGGGDGSKSEDNHLDLFSKTRSSLSSDDVSVKVSRVSIGSAKVSSSSSISNGIEDLLSSTDQEGGKHDYDWLLTPPGTPLFPSSQSESESLPSLAPPKRSMTRSTSTTKSSRLSVSQSENNNHNQSRPARSSSVTRPSVSSSHSQTQYNTFSSNRSSSSILNTSSASISSYIRPSSPISRSQSTASRPSTPSSRTTQSRPSTPSKSRSTADKSRPSPQSSRPSTPSSRPLIPANLHSPSAPPTRSLSRPSTPTRRNSMPSPSPTTASSAGRASLSGRNSAPVSRPSSPSPRPRPTPQPVVPSDFPLDTPPNLRTTLPDRPVSAGRSRPGAATLKTNSETQPSSVNNISRRHSSPIINRGRLTEHAAGKSRGYANSNGHHVDVPEPRKLSHAPEVGARRSVKSSTTATDNTGFGRTISKKSLDMAIKHMDIRNGSGNLRALSNTTLFPQSIRTSSTPKSQSHRVSRTPPSVEMNVSLVSSNNGAASFDVGNNINRNMMINGREVVDERQQYSAKLSEVVDIYESSRYDALLLKEDLKNTDWLHSADDKCDQDSIFGNGFEHLPEPFGLL